MKHIVLPIMDEPFEEKKIFRGLDPNYVCDRFFLILQSQDDSQEIIEVQGNMAKTYQIGINADWNDVIGNVQNSFLEQDFQCQVDCIVDASGTKRAQEIITNIQKVFPTTGITASYKILFLADARSQFYQSEQEYYNTLKNVISESDKGSSSRRFNCAYLMIAQNEEQKALRERILPYMLLDDTVMAKPEIRTCGGQVREMDINSLELIPKDLAIKTVCAMLSTRILTNPISLFLMTSGMIANKSTKEQLVGFKETLEKKYPISLPSAVDLLVQKGSPDGNCTTKDLFEKFCEDNPQSNPAIYDNANIESLAKMPTIVNAVYDWENAVIEQACEKGDLLPFIEQLRPESEFDKLISGHQTPIAMAAAKTLTDKDGYTETALQKLENYTNNLQESIRNSIYAARLRLIKSRMVSMRCRLEEVQRKRKEAVEEKLATIRTKDVAELIEKWCKDLSNNLTNAAVQVRLPKETDNVKKWIEDSARKLLELVPVPNYEKGKKELAESGEKLISNMKASEDNKLIAISLFGAVNNPLAEKWIVYRQMSSKEEYIKTEEPVVIKISEWSMNLEQCAQMDGILFQRPLNKVITQPVQQSAGQRNEKEETIAEKDLSRLVKREKEVLEIYNGTLSWIWADTQYTNARLEAFADTGVTHDMDKPILTQNIHFSPDDRYEIGENMDLPSGVPLLFRITCLNKGQDVENSVVEIRMRSRRTRLDVELINVKEGKFLNKRPYNRLKIRSNGSFSPQHIAIASSTGHIYSGAWEQTDDGWLSELLPCSENWIVVDRPGDLIEYEIIQ